MIKAEENPSPKPSCRLPACLWQRHSSSDALPTSNQDSSLMPEPISGKLLVASPYLNDPNFLRSVLLIVNHGSEGAFGLSLNRPTEQRLSEVLEMSMPMTPARADDYIFEGGPVEGPLLALHDLPDLGAPVVGHDGKTWITGDEDHLRMLLTRIDASVRFIAHYSGWGPGQLDAELSAGGWMVLDALPEIVFGHHDHIWETAVKQCGLDVIASLSPGVTTSDPSMN